MSGDRGRRQPGPAARSIVHTAVMKEKTGLVADVFVKGNEPRGAARKKPTLREGLVAAQGWSFWVFRRSSRKFY